jgi:hypothetical protein
VKAAVCYEFGQPLVVEEGRLRLDELITERYPLERINEAIASMERGEALRNVVVLAPIRNSWRRGRHANCFQDAGRVALGARIRKTPWRAIELADRAATSARPPRAALVPEAARISDRG